MINERILKLCDAANAVLDFMGTKFTVVQERIPDPNEQKDILNDRLQAMRDALHDLTPADTHPTVVYVISHNEELWGVSLKGKHEAINTMALAREAHWNETAHLLRPMTWRNYNEINRWNLERIGVV